MAVPGPEMQSEHSSCLRQELYRKQEKGNTSLLSYLKKTIASCSEKNKTNLLSKSKNSHQVKYLQPDV